MKLSQKLLEIQKACNYFQKDTLGYNFKYTAGSTILAVVRSKMDELGVLCYPKILEAKTTIIEVGKKPQIFTELNMLFIWRCTETDAQLEIPWYAQGLKDTEQGIGNALTYAERYFLLKFFKIPTDSDDPDAWNAKHTPENPEDVAKRKAEEEVKAKQKKIEMMQNAIRAKIGKNKEAWLSLLIDQGIILSFEQLKTDHEAVEAIYNDLKRLEVLLHNDKNNP